MLEKTLVIVKPDSVMMDWTQKIIARYHESNLAVLAQYSMTFTIERAAVFYNEYRGRPFFAGLVLGMSSGPVVAIVLEGDDAVERVHDLNGDTDPNKAKRGTIRGDFMSAGGPFNTVHGSESAEAAQREIALFETWFS